MYDVTLCVGETLRSKNRARIAFTVARVLYFVYAVVDICRTCPRETYRGQFTKRAVRRIDHNFTSRRIVRLSRCSGARSVNSRRKLIQDNYRDETLKHINWPANGRGSLLLSHCTILQRRELLTVLAFLVNAANILLRQSLHYRSDTSAFNLPNCSQKCEDYRV